MADFIDEIGKDIDLCILDTVHINPGEFLEYLMVLPYLKKNAVIVIHDIAMHEIHPTCTTCGTLFISLKGKKIYPISDKFATSGLANIGAVILADDVYDNVLDTFWALTFPWLYVPEEKHYLKMLDLFSKHYDKKYIDIFTKIFLVNKESFSKESSIIIRSPNKFVNKLAWWIPVLKWRNSFRSKFQ